MTSEWPRATVQYRLNLPNALYAISPALSALHASRAAALHPEISDILCTSHCPKCGMYRFSGDHPTYTTTRKKRKRSTLSLPRKCHLCGFLVDTTAFSSSPSPNNSVLAQLSSEMSRTRSIQAENKMVQESPSTATSQPTSATTIPSHTQSYTKMTLKEMLSRDRRREEGMKAHDKKKGDREGLAVFLKQL